VEQLLGQGQNLRVLGAHCEQTGTVLLVLEALEETQGRPVEDGVEQRLAQFRETGGNAGASGSPSECAP
jgi:hypothetical protein